MSTYFSRPPFWPHTLLGVVALIWLLCKIFHFHL